MLLLLVTLSYNATAQEAAGTASAQVTALLNEGKALLEGGQLDDALKKFEQILTLDPKHVEAHYRIGQVNWNKGNAKTALEYFKKSTELAPDNVSLKLSLAGFYEQARVLDEAIRLYREVLAAKANTPEAEDIEKRLNLALVKDYAGRGDMDSSLQLLNSLLEEYPNDTRVLQHLGFAYSLANRLAEAEKVYLQVIALAPQDESVRLNLAGIYERMGKADQAAEQLRKVQEINPKGPRAKEAQIRLNLIAANQLIQFSDYSGALEELNKVFQLEPNNPIANTQAAIVYRSLGNTDAAEQALKKVLDTVPNNLDARLKLGTLYLEKNNLIDAVPELEAVATLGKGTAQAEQAAKLLANLESSLGQQFAEIRNIALSKNEFLQTLKRDPNNVEAHFNLGIIYLRQNLLKEARSEFEAVTKLDPGIARAYLNLGQINSDLGQYSEAVDAFATYVSLERDQANIDQAIELFQVAIGQKMFADNRFDLALTEFKSVVAKNEKNLLAEFYLGLTQARKGALEEAAKSYQTVIAQAPGHLGARINLAIAYEQLSREEDALSEYRHVALGAPPGSIREVAEQRIEYLQRVINGFTTSANYAWNYDSNSSFSKYTPYHELRSDLSVTLNYRYKYSQNLRLGIAYSPTYITYHNSHSDYLNQAVNPFMVYGPFTSSWVASSSFTYLSGVMNELNVSQSNNFYLERSRKVSETLSYRARVSASDTTAQGADRYTVLPDPNNPAIAYIDPRTRQPVVILLKATRFDSRNYSGRLSFDKNLGKGYTLEYGYVYTVNVNKSQEGRDYAYSSHGLNLELNKFLSENLSSNTGITYTATGYKNPDSAFGKKRQNSSLILSGGLSYKLNDSLRINLSVSRQWNRSNLAVAGNYVNADERRLYEQGASLGYYNKNLIGLGLGLSF